MKKILYIIPFSFLAACTSNAPESNEEIKEVAEETVQVDTTAILLGQEVFFENLKDGQEVNSPLTIKMGVKGMEVEPANNGINENKGHHHLLIDTMGFIAPGTMVPMVENRIIHFGGGELEHTIELSPGEHSISLQFANGIHSSYGSRMSKTIKVSVK